MLLQLNRKLLTSMKNRCFPVILCADFDQTCTKDDTIHLVFELARKNRSKSLQKAHETQVSNLVKQYLEDMETFTTVFFQTHKHNKESLDLFLQGFGENDLKSIHRVEETLSLQGIPENQLTLPSKEIEMAPFCLQVLQKIQYPYIISANWNLPMIHETITTSLDEEINIQVIANELEIDSTTHFSTGKIIQRVQSPADKAKWVQTIRRQYDELPLVFVGDSTNDMLALLEADVGICICDTMEKSFYKYATKFGIQLESLGRNISTKCLGKCIQLTRQAKAKQESIIFIAEGWEEIQETLVNYRPEVQDL